MKRFLKPFLAVVIWLCLVIIIGDKTPGYSWECWVSWKAVAVAIGAVCIALLSWILKKEEK